MCVRGTVDACGVRVFSLNFNLTHRLSLDYTWHVLVSTNTLEQESTGQRDCGIKYTRMCEESSNPYGQSTDEGGD